ncbi:integrase catalytic domain-containing protein [Trichonephila clavipes]|nr:integrase catalytic domain-containing protein [Trichonephila clavipes]
MASHDPIPIPLGYRDHEFNAELKALRLGNNIPLQRILSKIYVAVFVCLATRVIHLEIVTGLNSDALMATLKRFFSRRGKCASIISDNATNFVKAYNDFKKLHNFVMQPDEKVSSFLSTEGVYWKFMPPKSPNFGGIWEPGVKSFKFHTKRIIGKLALTIKEFLTITVQIEGILNSRPLIQFSAENFEVLTPGHFLIGRALNAIVEPDLCSVNTNKLDKLSE